MSNSAPRDHRDLIEDLAESTRRRAQSEQDRFMAEASLPPTQVGGSDGSQPDGGTADQRSRYRQYSYGRPGSDQPAETRTPIDS